MLDLVLAIAHHVVVFTLFALVFGEMVALGGVLNEATVRRIARLDIWYGVLAAVILVVGFVRAIYASKGWAYYSHNAFFWAKIGTFALAGLLSIGPTLAFSRWRRTGLPDAVALKSVRLMVHVELTLLLLLPIFAAAMARGYGNF
jgi:putative membrane protein